MKQLSAGLLLCLISLASPGQSGKTTNTLLWKITGNGLEKPSYLYGTIHMICSDDAELSDNMKKVIRESDEVYFEVDMDNLLEMITVMGQMKMKGDTTLQDLLSEEDYNKVKNYFETKQSMLPFSMLETFKPMLAASTLQESSLSCESTSMMEQVIMAEARQYDKKIRGLETMSYQAGILDLIPYKLQAEQLLAYINGTTNNSGEPELDKMMKAYKDQDLDKLEELLISSDAGINSFTDILLYNRNENWVKKLKELMPEKSLTIAVGAGHLPGERGVINLLRKEGYTLTPIENKMTRTKII